MKHLHLAVALCAFAAAGLAHAQSAPVNVEASKQPLLTRRTESGVVASPLREVTVFKGIPYAAPPTGDLRWRAPQPVAPAKTRLLADHFAPSCMQGLVAGDSMLPWTHEFMTRPPVSEDCLYLNIWTPSKKVGPALPVIVYIHGGGFSGGSGEVPIYDGEALAKRGAVVVAINYRLGVFGFLAHPELTAESPEKTSGDYAILDMIAALGWVQRNIAQFGGDPRRVAIWGQSAGAMSVNILVASPLARGLFSRAVASSGVSLLQMAATPLSAGEASGAQWAAKSGAKSIAELRAMSAEAVLKAQQGSMFYPIVDGHVLPDSPLNRMRGGVDNDVAMMSGYMANDWFLSSARAVTLPEYKQFAARRYGSLADEFLALYPASNDAEAQASYVRSQQDRERVAASMWAAERSANHKAPTYVYYFDRGIPWPEHPEFGAFHSGELPYFFGNLSLMSRPWTAADKALSDASMDYLVGFARTGDPNNGKGEKWRAAEPSATNRVQRLGEKIGETKAAEAASLPFWRKFFASDQSQRGGPF